MTGFPKIQVNHSPGNLLRLTILYGTCSTSTQRSLFELLPPESAETSFSLSQAL